MSTIDKTSASLAVTAAVVVGLGALVRIEHLPGLEVGILVSVVIVVYLVLPYLPVAGDFELTWTQSGAMLLSFGVFGVLASEIPAYFAIFLVTGIGMVLHDQYHRRKRRSNTAG